LKASPRNGDPQAAASWLKAPLDRNAVTERDERAGVRICEIAWMARPFYMRRTFCG
jgi:hypothetical protein